MPFIQTIEYRTSTFEGVDKLGKGWEGPSARTPPLAGGPSCATARVPRATEHRFFDSYEDAMRNSDHPVTQEFAAKLAALVDAAPTFFNLDVVEEVEL